MSDLDPTLGRRTATDRRQHARYTTGFFTDDNKFGHVTDPLQRAAALTLHAASIGMTIEQGADGHVQPDEVLAATGLTEHPDIAKILIADGVWHEDDHGCARCPQPRRGHVYVHDTLEHNRTAAQEAKTAAARRANGAKGLNSRWAGHTPVVKEKRPVGRPRKNPLPAAAAAAPVSAAAGPGLASVLIHPAQARAEAEAAKKRGRPAAETRTYDPIVHELCQELAEVVERNGFSVGKLGPAWWKPCEQLLRIGPPNAKEGLTPDQIRAAIAWANNDAFWWEHIRSMNNLREKYEQLRAAAKNQHRTKRGAAGAVTRRLPSTAPAAVAVPGLNALFDDDYAGGSA
jgi:hypothetical protein